MSSGLASTTQNDPAGDAAPHTCPTCGVTCPASYNVCPQDGTPLTRAEHEDSFVGIVLNGTYKIERVLATGGMGRLYEASHIRLGRSVAVKVMHQVYADRKDSVARFEREARATGRIRSPNVVDVIDVLTTPDGRPCLVTELLEGEDLQLRLDRDGSLSVPLAIRIARQMCRGLAAAHTAGVIHRDLKPSNIFLGDGLGTEPLVKVLDFGVAKLLDAPELTRTGALVGTPTYMAPEQARGSSGVDERADVYGIGAVLYRMVTGRPPYLLSSRSATIEKVLTEDPRRPRSVAPDIPPALDELIQRAMARDPNLRLPSAAALDRELQLLDRDGAPEIPNEDSGIIRARRLRRRAKGPSRLHLAAVVAACIASFTLAVAALLTEIGRLDGPTDPSRSRWLIGIGTLASAAGFSYLLIKNALRRWQSSPALLAMVTPMQKALIAGMTILGASELARLGLDTYGLTLWPRTAWLLGALVVAVVMYSLAWWGRRVEPR